MPLLLYRSVSISFQKIFVGVNAAVSEKWPAAANFFLTAEIALDDQHFLAFSRFREHDAERVTNEGVPPELEPAVIRPFVTDAIHRRDEHSVGDGVALLHRLPRRELRAAVYASLDC